MRSYIYFRYASAYHDKVDFSESICDHDHKVVVLSDTFFICFLKLLCCIFLQFLEKHSLNLDL